MTRAEQTAQPHVEREVEQKFRVHGLFHLPDLSSVDGVGSVEDLGSAELESAYFDTEDHRLIREGITLRRRTGADEGWHLKLPAEGAAAGVRDEIRLPLSAAAYEPPEQLLHIVRGIVRDSPVGLVATLRTHRSSTLLRTAKGKPIAELVDDTVHVIGTDGAVTARFRELELEKRKGGKALARAASVLTAAGAVSGEFVAKAVRALGPAASAPPEIPMPVPPTPDDPAGATVHAYLSTHARALRAADLDFRRRPDASTDAVHRMRVAARRLRGGLRTFRPLLDTERAQDLQSALTWFAHGLNDLRENDVLQARLTAHSAELTEEVPVRPMLRFVHEALSADAATAKAAAERMLDSDRYLELHESLVTTLRDFQVDGVAAVPAREVLPKLVQKVWKQLSKAADALTEDSPEDEWHRVRLLAKRARYAGEAVAMAIGREATAFARQMEQLTDILGEHQDACQAVHVLHRLAQRDSTDPEIIFALGALTTAEYGHARAARSRFDRIWADARQVRPPRAWKVR